MMWILLFKRNALLHLWKSYMLYKWLIPSVHQLNLEAKVE